MNYERALKLLGLGSHPKPIEIKKAYRLLALKFHPDRNPHDLDNVEQFRIATEAYNYLIENIGQWGFIKGAKEEREVVIDLENIFDDIFGFTREDRILGYQEPQSLGIDLVQVAFGARINKKVIIYVKCTHCQGTGAQKNTIATICTHCFGRGLIERNTIKQEALVCPKCEGRGRYVKKACAHCVGYGRVKKMRRQLLTLPQGLIPSQSYTLHSEDLDRSTKHDLFVTIKLNPHPVFTVDCANILCEYPVGQSQACHGERIDFPSVDGWLELTLKAGLADGNKMILKDKGLLINPGSNQHGFLEITFRVLPDRKAQKRAAQFLKMVSKGNAAYQHRSGWLTHWFKKRSDS